MTNFIGIYDKALSSKQCKDLIFQFEQGTIERAGLWNGKEFELNPSIKDCWQSSYSFSDSSSAIINQGIHQCLTHYTERYVNVNKPLTENIRPWSLYDWYNIQKYNPGQGYHNLHCEMDGTFDYKREDRSYLRMLVWMIYLNTVRDKGGTSFPQYNKIIKAREGRLVIWPAYWTHIHKGIVSNTETKYIATGWYIYKESK